MEHATSVLARSHPHSLQLDVDVRNSYMTLCNRRSLGLARLSLDDGVMTAASVLPMMTHPAMGIARAPPRMLRSLTMVRGFWRVIIHNPLQAAAR